MLTKSVRLHYFSRLSGGWSRVRGYHDHVSVRAVLGSKMMDRGIRFSYAKKVRMASRSLQRQECRDKTCWLLDEIEHHDSHSLALQGGQEWNELLVDAS